MRAVVDAAAVAARRRGCRSAWSRGSCDRAAPGSCAGRRRLPAGASRRRAVGDAGGGASRRSVLVSSRRPRAERKSAFSAPRASCGRTRGGRPPAGARPPRRAARPVPCRPCRVRGRAPGRSRRRRGRGRRPPASEAPPSRRARRSVRLRRASGAVPSSAFQQTSTSAGAARRAAGAAALGRAKVGHASLPEREAEERPHRGELARDCRRRELRARRARPSSAA